MIIIPNWFDFIIIRASNGHELLMLVFLIKKHCENDYSYLYFYKPWELHIHCLIILSSTLVYICSNFEEVIAKFAQLTSQERAKRYN